MRSLRLVVLGRIVRPIAESYEKQTKRLGVLTGDLVYLSKMEESENTIKKIVFSGRRLL